MTVLCQWPLDPRFQPTVYYYLLDVVTLRLCSAGNYIIFILKVLTLFKVFKNLIYISDYQK